MKVDQREKMVQAQSLLYTTIDNQTIQLISILGIGAYGIVYLGQDQSGQHFAVKLLTHANMSRRETEIHAFLSGHPNILRFEKIVREGNRTFMIIEYTPEGDLFGAITKRGRGVVGNNDAIRHIFLQIIDAVQYCHQNGVYHRDLKPENIMLDSHWRVKLADFGLATTHQVSDEFGCGSTFYFSPECQGGTFRNHGRIKGYSTEKNDIWSLGVILINLVAGRNPWKQAHMRNATFAAYVRHPRHFFQKILPCISEELEGILLRIFCLDPALRISLHELRFHILRINFIATSPASSPLPLTIHTPFIPKPTQIHYSQSTVLHYVACYTDEEETYPSLYNVPDKPPCFSSSDTSSISSHTSFCSNPQFVYFNTQKLDTFGSIDLRLYQP